MHITALVENDRLAERPGLVAEHGLSLHIQRGAHSILFDVGPSGAFADNARQLGVSIKDVEQLVISHHHYDHGGGLPRFLEENDHAPIFLRPRAAGEGYGRLLGGLIKRRVDFDLALLDKHPSRFHFVAERKEIADDVVVLTDIHRRHPLPRGNRLLFRRLDDGSFISDEFEHELVLVVRDSDGLVVFTGCSHRGVLNMVDAVREAFPGEPMKALFRGFHLIGLPVLNTLAGSPSEVKSIGEQLAEYGIARIFTFHCTGPKAYRILATVLGDKLEPCPTGRSVEV